MATAKQKPEHLNLTYLDSLSHSQTRALHDKWKERLLPTDPRLTVIKAQLTRHEQAAEKKRT